MKRLLILLLPILFTSCKDKLYVTNQMLTPDYLASSFVGSPDPTAKHFGSGVQLTFQWVASSETMAKDPELVIDMIFGDLTEQRFEFKITKSSGYQTIRLLEPVFTEKKGVLTYRAEMVTSDHQVVTEWKHQLWTPLLHIDGETI